MFKLTSIEYNFLRSQIATLENQTSFDGRGKYSKYLPTAFTQEGVSMLSGLLNSDVAIQVNIAIMRAFVAVRQLLLHAPVDRTSLLQQELKDLKQYIEEVFSDQNDINEDTRIQLELINNTLAALQAKNSVLNKPRKAIGFKTNNT